MSQADGLILRCQICEKVCGSREEAMLHLQKHVIYKKYPCESCTESFYSDALREEHCSSKKHHHAFKVNIDQYKEMLVNMIYKDMENLRIHDVDVVVATRAKYNAEYDSLMQTIKTTPKQEPVTPKNVASKTDATPASRKRRSSVRATTPKPAATSPPSVSIAPAPSAKKTVTKVAETPKNEEQRKRTVSMTNISLADPVLTPGTLSDAINLSLTTTEANAKCVMCRNKVPIDYVSRKDHVSKCHMPAAHDDSDYVQILEQRMQEAFPYLTYSDIQCQFDGCGLKFQSDSGRRKHALIHAPIQLKCPMCDLHEVEAKKVNKHLRDMHHLEDGWKSIEDRNIRSEFEQKYMEQNQMVIKVYAKSFPVIIPSVYLNPRSSTKPQNPNTFSSVLGEMVRDARAFQQIPNVPPRRLSESTDSEDEREKKIRKRKQDRSECEQKEFRRNRNTQRPSASSSLVGECSESLQAVSSDDEDMVTQFAEVKEESPTNDGTSAPISSKSLETESGLAVTASKKKNNDTVESDQGTATSSESEITFLGEKKSRKKRKMISEEEVKKEPDDENSDLLSTNSANQSSSTSDVQELKEEAPVAEQRRPDLQNERHYLSHEGRKSSVKKTRWDSGPATPLQLCPPPHDAGNRKKGTELNMTLENQRPSYALLPRK